MTYTHSVRKCTVDSRTISSTYNIYNIYIICNIYNIYNIYNLTLRTFLSISVGFFLYIGYDNSSLIHSPLKKVKSGSQLYADAFATVIFFLTIILL